MWPNICDITCLKNPKRQWDFLFFCFYQQCYWTCLKNFWYNLFWSRELFLTVENLIRNATPQIFKHFWKYSCMYTNTLNGCRRIHWPVLQSRNMLWSFVGKNGHSVSVPYNWLLFTQTSSLHNTYNEPRLRIYATTDKHMVAFCV